MRALRPLSLTLATAVILAACGGGDSSSRNRNAALTSESPLTTKVAAISAGDNTAMVTLSDGSMVRLGINDVHKTHNITSIVQDTKPVKTRSTFSKAGVLNANGTLTIRGYEWQRDTPVLPSGAKQWVDFDFAVNGTLAITDDGRVVTKFRGAPPATPVLKSPATGFVRVEAGMFHAAYLDDRGSAYLIGNGGTVPALRNGGTKFVDVAANFNSTGFVDDAGNAYLTGWIMDDFVIPALRNEGTKFVDVEIGTSEAVLLDDKGNGYVVGPKVTNPPLNPAPTGSFVATAAGTNFSLWLDKDGRLTTHNHYAGTSGPGLVQRIPTVAVAAGGNSTFVVDDAGTAQQFGGDMTDAAPARTDIVSIGAGVNHAVAITSSGTPVAWGQNGNAQATAPARDDLVKVVGGPTYSLGLTRAGHLISWGTTPEISNSLDAIAVASFEIWANGLVADISAGSDHYTVLTRRGDVYSTGSIARLAPNLDNSASANRFGRDDIMQALQGKPLSNYVAIATYGTCSAAINNTAGIDQQSLVTWGTCPSVITNAPSLASVVSLSIGSDHALALTTEGKIIAWGDNTYGQMSVPDGMANIVHIAAGTNHSVAVDSSGRVWAWGDNSLGQTTIPASLRMSASEFTAVHEARQRLLNTPPAPAAQDAVTSPLDNIVPPNAPPAAIEAVQRTLDAAPQTTVPATTKTGLAVKKGRSVTPAQALRLMKVRGGKTPAFVVGKTSRTASCRVAAKRVTMTRQGTCTAVVSYVNSKGKKASTTLVVTVTP